MDARRLRFGAMLAATLGVVGLALALGVSRGGGEQGDVPTTATSATSAMALPANALRCTATTLGGSRTANAALAGDCDALLAMESTLAGTGTLNWEAGVALESWKGVTVEGMPKRVTRLELKEAGLTGTIPTQVGNLTGLTGLDLSGNGLTGAIPAELGSLTKLRTLALSGNALTGCVPNALWSVATRDIAYLRLDSCTAPTRLPRWQVVGAGTYYFDDYPTSHTGARLVITVGTERQIRWASTLYTTGDGEPGSVWFILVDVSSGKEFAYNAYTGETHERELLLPTGASGQADTAIIDAFFDRITNSMRMEDGP